MKLKSFYLWSVLAVLVSATACTKSSPVRPSDVVGAGSTASVTDAVSGITLTTPQPVTPVVNQQFKNVDQPVTLTVKNAVTTGLTALTYSFQVANDAGFASIAYSKDGVAEGSGGQTALKIDKLAPDKDYFWRARVLSGSVVGPYSAGRALHIGPEVILQTPVRGDPQNNAVVGGQPTLNVNAVSRTGPAGQIVYRFEVSESASFASLVDAATVTERSDLPYTPHLVATKLSATTYFWRVQASDPSNAVTTGYSSTGQFTVQLFDIAKATFWDNPSDTGSWPVGARITYVEFTGFSLRVDFDRRQGSNAWPNIPPPGFEGPLQYTLGMCRNIEGQWHCSAVVQFWEGRSLDDTDPPSNFWRNWWYDSARWGPLASVRPVEGETVGIFVASGDLRLRHYTRASCPNFCEISDVVLVPFTSGYAKYEY